MRRILCTALIFNVFVATALASSYRMPSDYQIACLDAMTGEVIWKTKPEKLARPAICAFNDVVIAMSHLREGNQKTFIEYQLDAKTGKLLELDPALRNRQAEWVLPFDPLPRKLSVTGGPISGDLAMFVREFTRSRTYAFNLKTQKVEWEFDASSWIPNLHKKAYVGIEVDGDRVLVSMDQTIFCLSAKNGQLEWMIKLPRQTIRILDAPITKIGRSGDVLFVQCYEDLFALRADDGKLLWSFDCGPFGAAWPTIVGNRIFVGVREPDPEKRTREMD